MAKYTYEFKRKIVEEYLNGNGGQEYLAKKYSINSSTTVQKWLNAYKTLGNEGLMRTRKNKEYSLEYKLNVVELYLSTELSYQELANQLKMNNPALICKWVNDYQIAGIDALKSRKRGRKRVKKDKIIEMPKKKKEEFKDDEYQKKLEELEEENLKLRIENAYLKELRRLRLQEIQAKEKQK